MNPREQRINNFRESVRLLLLRRQDPHDAELADAAGVEGGRAGCFRSRTPACSGVRSAFRLLQSTHDSTQFSQVEVPPCDRGKTWNRPFLDVSQASSPLDHGIVS